MVVYFHVEPLVKVVARRFLVVVHYFSLFVYHVLELGAHFLVDLKICQEFS